MGEIKIILPDDVERAFRKAAMEKHMYQKGAVSKAASAAIKEWIDSRERKREANWDRFVGVLSHVKKTSVELQHAVWDDVTKKHVHRQ